MNVPTEISALAKLFEQYGVQHPEQWARSQINEDIPQLQRYLFLRQAWKQVLRDGDLGWIEKRIKQSEQFPSAPFAGIGGALKRSIANGATPEDITEIARSVQVELLSSLCYLLDDPAFRESELEDFAWGLFEVDEDDRPFGPRIGSLHESVLGTDPTGREMRPKGARDA